MRGPSSLPPFAQSGPLVPGAPQSTESKTSLSVILKCLLGVLAPIHLAVLTIMVSEGLRGPHPWAELEAARAPSHTVLLGEARKAALPLNQQYLLPRWRGRE